MTKAEERGVKMELQVEKGGCERCHLAENSTHETKKIRWSKVRDSGQLRPSLSGIYAKKGHTIKEPFCFPSYYFVRSLLTDF
jgi:hypothetical protein